MLSWMGEDVSEPPEKWVQRMFLTAEQRKLCEGLPGVCTASQGMRAAALSTPGTLDLPCWVRHSLRKGWHCTNRRLRPYPVLLETPDC